MEGDEQRRRGYEQPNYPRGYGPDPRTQGANVSNVQHLRGTPGGEGSDRFRQGQLLTTQPPTTAGAGSAQDLGSFGYAQGQHYTTPQMQGTSFQYQPEYVQETPRQRQFPHYAPQMMYNVQQQQPQPQSPYDPVGQYQARQTPAVEVLSNQFGVPQYYNPGEGTNVSGPAGLPQQYQTAAYQQPLHYNPPASLTRSTLASPYPTMAAEFGQEASAEVPEQPQQGPDMFAQYYDQYKTALRQTNENTSKGNLIEAGKLLLTISEWLLAHASELGLSKDDQEKHDQRIELWNDFNICWLAALQRQKDDTRKWLDSGQSPNPPQNLIPVESLNKLGNDLIGLCDGLEKHGLVDYEMGVSEEEIINILTQCADLLSTEEEDDPDTEPEPATSPSIRGADMR